MTAYSEEGLSEEQIARQNLCMDEIRKVLEKHFCRLETRVEIVGDQIYPSIVCRAKIKEKKQ